MEKLKIGALTCHVEIWVETGPDWEIPGKSNVGPCAQTSGGHSTDVDALDPGI